MPDAALDLAPLDSILDEFRGQKGAVIPILQRTQETHGYLPAEALAAISKKAGRLKDLLGALNIPIGSKVC